MPSKYAGIALREHHALPAAARAADEVLPIGRAAVIARHDRQGDRRGPLVRGVGMIDARLQDRDRTPASRPDAPRPSSRPQSRAAVRCPGTIRYCDRPPARRCRRCRRRPDTGSGRSNRSADEARSASRRPCRRRRCAAPPTRARRSAPAAPRIRHRRSCGQRRDRREHRRAERRAGCGARSCLLRRGSANTATARRKRHNDDRDRPECAFSFKERNRLVGHLSFRAMSHSSSRSFQVSTGSPRLVIPKPALTWS